MVGASAFHNAHVLQGFLRLCAVPAFVQRSKEYDNMSVDFSVLSDGYKTCFSG
jgi:hypothetical protein